MDKIVKSTFTVIFNLLGSELFWVCIVMLMGIGRWLLLRETLLFAGKKNIDLTLLEKKKKKRLIFWGKGLLSVGLGVFILLLIILILPTKD